MNSCRLTRQDILRALDGELPLAEVLSLDAHLEACPACRAYRTQQLELSELLQLLPEPALERLDSAAAIGSIRAQIQAGASQPELAALERASWEQPLIGRRWGRLAARALLLAAGLTLVVMGWRWQAAEDPQQEPLSAPRLAEQGNRTQAGDAPRLGVDSEPLAAAQPEPASLTRESVEAKLRVTLLQAFGAPGSDLLRASALERFDQSIDHSYARWPLASMAERLLTDADGQLASAAARYLGLRGGRLSVASLRAGLARPEVAAACVLALGDLGELGAKALGAALESAALRSSATDQLVRGKTMAAAEVIEAALRAPDLEPSSKTYYLNALGAMGAPAMGVLLRLAVEPSLARAQVVEAMLLVDGAGAELARLAKPKRGRGDAELLFEVMDQLGALEMLPWLEERLGDSEHRQRALLSLSSLGGTAPVATLMGLSRRGSLSEAELHATLGRLSSKGPGRMRRYAEEVLQAGDAMLASQLLNLLIQSANPGGAGALAVLALSELLNADERQWAALAVGELGGADEALSLQRALAAGELSDRRLMAACLISVFRSLGEEGVHEALSSYPLGAVNEVFKTLVESSTDPKQPQPAVQLFRIARVLNTALVSRNPRTGPSS